MTKRVLRGPKVCPYPGVDAKKAEKISLIKTISTAETNDAAKKRVQLRRRGKKVI
jgi:hypothetical protein